MKKLTALLLFTSLVFACRHQTADTPEEVKLKLKKTMTNFLYKGINNDSTHVKYQVLDVVYFDDVKKDEYVCEFDVRMKERNLDTTGKMSARISRDMTRVFRRY